MDNNPDPAGFGVYIHWPFCAAKCPYCDFNSHVRHGGVDQSEFLAGYLREIEHMRDKIGSRRTETVFFGGGTPSLMDASTVETILDAVNKAWPVANNAEITLEANPSSVEAERFKGYRAAGINRVSLGVQALNDADLKSLGRLHNVAEAMTALEVAASTFDRYSFDLIYARPGQSKRDWEAELGQAIAMGTRHLSLYQLTIEEGTPFAALHKAGRLKVPDPELADELFALTQQMTDAAGLPAYEVSNHAAQGEESRHNLLYWRYGEYVGLGPGAHGRIIVADNRYATSTERLPERWLSAVAETGSAFSEYESVNVNAQADELLLMGLRISEGADLARLAAIAGVQIAQSKIAELEGMQLLAHDAATNRIHATPQG
ncbi:MAG: radical SAM family heme chaperone HemW, partial [Pseudomonadota bacterium]